MRRALPAAAILLLPGSALAATYTVASDGSGDFTTISSAISAAKSGDRVEVAAGTYTETIRFDGKDLELVGVDGSESTILDGAGSPLEVVTFNANETSDAVLEGFTVRNSGARAISISSASPTLRDVVVASSGATMGSGGGVIISGGSPSFESCSFEDNTAWLGAHVYVTGSATPTFTDTTFTGGEAGDKGGAIYADSGALTVVSSTFDDNYSVGSGGAIALNVAVTLSMDDTTLTDNHSDTANGAGVFGAGNNTIDITSSDLSSNYPYDYTSGYGGGALYLASGTLNVSDTTFDANYAYYGAALMLYGTTATFSNVVFSTNYAYYGGAIYLGSNTTLVDSGSTYDTNTSYYYGAGIYAYYYFDMTFTGVTFNENAAYYGYGGAIYASSAGEITSTDSVYNDNYAYYYGGAIYAYALYGDVIADGCTFTENVATYGYGGAIYTYYLTDMIVSDSTFTYNEAYYSGGALYGYYYGSMDVRDSVFTYNLATNISGGAVYFDPLTTGYDLSFVGNEVVGNVSRYEGGGLYSHYGSSVLIEGNTFEGNSLEDDSFGGGLTASDYGDLVIWGNTLTGNEAIIGGGAYVGPGYDDSATAWMVNNVFAENAAHRVAGGAALVQVPDATVENNTMLGNQALEGGGALYIYDSPTTMRNNLFAHTVDGEAVTFEDAEALVKSSITYNDFYGNTDGDQGGDLATITLDETNLAVDPQLARYSLDGSPENDSYVLARTSPCVDAGDPELVDPDGTRSDIGALGGPYASVQDGDADGYTSASDCDDDDATVYPGASETWYDGVNTDCGAGSDYDQDGDGVDAWDYYGDDCDDLDATTTDCASPDTADTADTGEATDTADPDTDSQPQDTGDGDGPADTAQKDPGGCSCASGGPRGAGLSVLALALVGLIRRRR